MTARSGLTDRLAIALGLAIALFGLTHSLPTLGVLPRMGPYPLQWYFPLMLVASGVAALLSKPFGRPASTMRQFGWAVSAAFIGLLIWAGVAFYNTYVELQTGLVFFETWQAWLALVACFVGIVMCWHIWGAPLALFSGVALAYFYFGYLIPGLFQAPRFDFVDGTSENLWFSVDQGAMGPLFGLALYTVMPFILLGSMLTNSGGAESLIRIAIWATRNLRGGAAHAAITASAVFGMVSGNAITNVLGTGSLTIPMMKRRGFSPKFAGGVEATASCAGQIMPPVMGAAAIIMADLTGVAYLSVLIAALIPALAYYASLYTAVAIEARRIGIRPAAEDEDLEALRPRPADYGNLFMVFAPVCAVVFVLVQGYSAAAAGQAGLATSIAVSVINPAIRKAPQRILEALGKGGVQFARLIFAIFAVNIVVSVLNATGLPTVFANMVESGTGTFFLTLFLAMATCLLLGMGMPTLPAYLTVVLIIGPAVQAGGLSPLTTHMFVLYYAVASSLTPPGALAAYAAASIAGSKAMETALTALRVGAVKFMIPFIFAYYPAMLLGDGPFVPGEFASVVIRTLIVIYLISSSLVLFDLRKLHPVEGALRALAAFGLLYTVWQVQLAAGVVAVGLLAWHRMARDNAPAPAA